MNTIYVTLINTILLLPSVIINSTIIASAYRLSDWVYSYDTTTTGEVSQKQVTAVFERKSDHLNYLTIIDATGKEQTLETTDGHPFWVVSDQPDLSRAAREVVDENGIILYHENLEPGLNGFWVETKDLKVGDVFLGANGELSMLTNIVRVEFDDEISVFNFTVEGNHNYFVLAKEYDYGQTCVLVHNAIGYRAVSGAEFDDIAKTGRFRQGDPGTSYPGKWFTTTPEGAAGFKDKMSSWANPPKHIVKAEVPDSAIERFSKMHDGISDSFYVGPDKISLIKPL